MDGHDSRLWDWGRPEPATRTRPADDRFGDRQLLRGRPGMAFTYSLRFPRVAGITCVPDATDASARRQAADVDPGSAADSVHGGLSHPHPVPAIGRCAGRWRGFRASPASSSTQIQNTWPLMGISSQHDGRLCRAPAGTMCRHAGKSGRAASPGASPFRDIKYSLTVPGSCPAWTSEVADRTSEPDRRLDREPPCRPVFGSGM